MPLGLYIMLLVLACIAIIGSLFAIDDRSYRDTGYLVFIIASCFLVGITTHMTYAYNQPVHILGIKHPESRIDEGVQYQIVTVKTLKGDIEIIKLTDRLKTLIPPNSIVELSQLEQNYRGIDWINGDVKIRVINAGDPDYESLKKQIRDNSASNEVNKLVEMAFHRNAFMQN